MSWTPRPASVIRWRRPGGQVTSEVSCGSGRVRPRYCGPPMRTHWSKTVFPRFVPGKDRRSWSWRAWSGWDPTSWSSTIASSGSTARPGSLEHVYAANEALWAAHGMETNGWMATVQYRDQILARNRTMPPGSGGTVRYRYTIQKTSTRRISGWR